VFDYDTPKAKMGHNLSKLFEGLKQESQDKLDAEFRLSVAPLHTNFLYVDCGIRNVLAQHDSAFVDWRYAHEKKRIRLDESTFVATLEMVLGQFRKRYRTVKVPTTWPSA
jgi:hypothetical protein